MRKKIKSIIITAFLSAVLIAGIIEIGKVLNICQSDMEEKELNKMSANAMDSVFTWPQSLSGARTDHMYTFIPDGNTFCGGHGWTLTLRKYYASGQTPVPDIAGGGRAQQVTYSLSKTTEMAQSIAYIRAFGGSAEDIQYVVWASRDWSKYTGGTSCLVDSSQAVNVTTTTRKGLQGRATQFANFVYQALNGSQKLGITYSPVNENDSSLKVMVNQSNKTYTVGPYTIKFQNQNTRAIRGNETMGELVYKEITRQNIGQTDANTFCKGQMIAKIIYKNGTYTNLDSSKFSLIDANGDNIQNKFPKFGQTFYIRYNAGDADIKEIKPIVQVNYLKKITNGGSVYHAYTYQSKSIKFKMIQDNAGVLRDAVQGSRLSVQLKQLSPGWLIKQLSYEYNVFHDMWFNDDGSINSNGSINDKSNEVANKVKEELKNKIQKQIESWGVKNVDVDVPVEHGLCYRDVFYKGGSIGHTETVDSYTLTDYEIVVKHKDRFKDYMDM